MTRRPWHRWLHLGAHAVAGLIELGPTLPLLRACADCRWLALRVGDLEGLGPVTRERLGDELVWLPARVWLDAAARAL